jgi:hypothetical protein
MKRLLVAISTAIAVGLMASASAVASGGSTLDLSPLGSGQCGPGTLVVNVTQHVINDADSGLAGYWAFDKYDRHIKVWRTAPDTYCAILRYDGEFTTVAGRSPQNTGTVAAGIQGDFKGGYRATQFTGTFAATKPTSGNLGTFDYACVLSAGNTVATCNHPDWLTFYFSSTNGFDLNWWGWIYTTEANGTWVNAISGNLGDITGVPPSDQNGDNQHGDNQHGDNQHGDNQHGDNQNGDNQHGDNQHGNH